MDLLCFCSVLCLLCLCARPFICALWSPAGKGLTSWLSFVVSAMSLSLSHRVRCGTWLYRFLIYAPLLTLFHSKWLSTVEYCLNTTDFSNVWQLQENVPLNIAKPVKLKLIDNFKHECLELVFNSSKYLKGYQKWISFLLSLIYSSFHTNCQWKNLRKFNQWPDFTSSDNFRLYSQVDVIEATQLERAVCYSAFTW